METYSLKKIEEIWEGHTHRTFGVGMLLSDEMVPRFNYALTGYCIYNSDSWSQANFWQFPCYAVVFQRDKKNLPDRCFSHLWRVFFCFRFSSSYYFLYRLKIISVIRSYSSCFLFLPLLDFNRWLFCLSSSFLLWRVFFFLGGG